MKKLIGYAVLCVMLLCSTIGVMAAEDEYIGKTITLEKQEGEVEIFNSAGRELQLRDSSKMYNGYETFTKDGYVWIVLDKNGVLKMDMDTQIKIEKVDNKLEVILEEGEVFFNISEQFAETEEFTIKTSTMTTGIRGTAGIVSSKTIEDKGTEFSLILLEGKVKLVYNIDNATKMELAEQLHAGQMFQLIGSGEDVIYSRDQMLESRLVDLKASDVDGFAAVEIRDDLSLQQRILADLEGIDEATLNEIIKNCDAKLLEDEALRNSLMEAIEALKKQEYNRLYALANPKKEQVSVPKEEPKEEVQEEPKEEVQEEQQQSTDSNTDTNTDSNTETPAPVDVTITYKYQDEVMATQTIKSDQVPVKPWLQPTAFGYWSVGGAECTFTETYDTATDMIWIDTGEVTPNES